MLQHTLMREIVGIMSSYPGKHLTQISKFSYLEILALNKLFQAQ